MGPMKYVGFYFLTGGVISVSLLVAALWIHRREVRWTNVANALGVTLMCGILWPLLAFHFTRISRLLCLFVGLDELSVTLQAVQKDRQQALLHPPYCSSVVRFDAATCSDFSGAHGVFQFPAEAVESEIQAQVSRYPTLMNDDEGGLLAWLQNRHRDDPKPVSVPACWPRVIHTIDALLRAGIGSAHCPSCRKDFHAQQLTTRDETGHNGWNHNQLLCPVGHLLLRRKRIRILKPRHKNSGGEG
jgi:hypothetical protein